MFAKIYKAIVYGSSCASISKARIGKYIDSPLFVVTKSSEAFRLMLDLKFLNSFMKVYPFKMESLETIISVVNVGD